jgi:hypothetical protein
MLHVLAVSLSGDSPASLAEDAVCQLYKLPASWIGCLLGGLTVCHHYWLYHSYSTVHILTVWW